MEWNEFSEVVLDKVCRHPRCAEIAIAGKPSPKSPFCQKCFLMFKTAVEFVASQKKYEPILDDTPLPKSKKGKK